MVTTKQSQFAKTQFAQTLIVKQTLRAQQVALELAI